MEFLRRVKSHGSRQKRQELWEQRCNRCGLCCHEKYIDSLEVVFDLDSYCEHYDPETRSCRVYAKRLIRQVRCSRVTRFKAMTSRYLPDECAYVQWARSRHIRFAPYRRIRYVHSSDSDPEDGDQNTSIT